jgi:DNA-binding NtrC family response regulator
MRKEMNESVTDDSRPAAGRETLVYVVDDEPMLLELAAMILEPFYRVTTFRDPGLALKSFTSSNPRPALVITDYAMNSSNGLMLLDACRKVEPRQKFLLVSGTVDESIYTNAKEQPNRFLAKPYQSAQLLETVRSLLKT